jgi:hypothetical protein
LRWRIGLAAAALAAAAGLVRWVAIDRDLRPLSAAPATHAPDLPLAGSTPELRAARSPDVGVASGVQGATNEPEPPGEARLREIESAWRAAADGRDEDGSQLARLSEGRQDADPAVAALAAQAIEDLFALEAVRQGLWEPGPREIDAVVEEALGSAGPDEVRAAAIDELTLREEPEAIEALLEVARSDPSPDNRHTALESLWRRVADGRDVDGSVQSAIEAALGDPDPQITALAESALADLAKLPPLPVPAEPVADGLPGDLVDSAGSDLSHSAPSDDVPTDDAPAPSEGAVGSDLVLREQNHPPAAPVDTSRLENVAAAAVSEPDPGVRGRAIKELSLSVDEYPEAQDALRDIARYDDDAGNRHRAVETLWRAVADGSDSDGLIREQLEESVADKDPGVRKLARHALADLDALESETEEAGSEEPKGAKPPAVPTL